MRTVKSVPAAIIALLFLIPPAASAMDLYWETQKVNTLTCDGNTEEVSISQKTLSLKDNLLRVDKKEKKEYRIYNFHQRVAVSVLEDQVFTEFSFTELSRKVRNENNQIRNSLSGQEKNLGSLPKKERKTAAAKIEAQREKQKLWSGRYSVRKSGEKKTIAGHPCVKYEGTGNGKVFQEIWVAEDIDIDGNYKIYYARRMRMIDREAYSHLALIPGFPMKVVTHYGPLTITREVTRVEERKIPADVFTLSEDLKPADSAHKPR